MGVLTEWRRTMNYRQDVKYRRMIAAQCAVKNRKEDEAKAKAPVTKDEVVKK